MSHDYVLRCIDHGAELDTVAGARKHALTELWHVRETLAMFHRVVDNGTDLGPSVRVLGAGEIPLHWFDEHRSCRVILLSDIKHDVNRFQPERGAWTRMICGKCLDDETVFCRITGRETRLACRCGWEVPIAEAWPKAEF